MNRNNRTKQQRRKPSGKPSGARRLKKDQIVEMRRFTQPGVPVHKFVRTTSQILSIIPNTGFQGSTIGFDLQMGFSLSTTNFYVTGSLVSAASNPGSGDFTALFDFYKLDHVEVSLMYSANAVSPGVLTTATLPIMNIVFDPSDLSAMSLSSTLQYNNLQTVQLGNQRTQSGYVVKFQPRVRAYVGASAVAGIETDPWISKDIPTAEYFGLKIFYDNAGSTLTTVAGTVTIYTKYFWSFKLSQ